MTRSIRFILAALFPIAIIASSAMAGLDPIPFINEKKYKHIIVRPLPLLDNGEVDPVALVIESSIVSEDVMAPLSDKQKVKLLEIIEFLKENQDFSVIEKDWKKFVKDLSKARLPVDINSIIQQVLRDSYLEGQDDLIFYAQRVKYYNSVKDEIRGLRDIVQLRVNDMIFCIPSDDIGEECPFDSIEELEAELARLEDHYQEIGDEASLASGDLQHWFEEWATEIQWIEKFQKWSPTAKLLHDTAIAVIRKMTTDDDEDNSEDE